MREDKLYLTHIDECIASIERFVADGYEAFKISEVTQAGVLYKLQTLAESTQRLSEPIKASHAEIDWTGIKGFRNRLVHDYLGINLAVVWKVIQNDLPPLKIAVKAMLNHLEDGSEQP